MSGHFGEAAVEVFVKGEDFEVVLTNHVTGSKVTILLPQRGMFSDAMRPIDQDTARSIGNDIAHRLRSMLE